MEDEEGGGWEEGKKTRRRVEEREERRCREAYWGQQRALLSIISIHMCCIRCSECGASQRWKLVLFPTQPWSHQGRIRQMNLCRQYICNADDTEGRANGWKSGGIWELRLSVCDSTWSHFCPQKTKTTVSISFPYSFRVNFTFWLLLAWENHTMTTTKLKPTITNDNKSCILHVDILMFFCTIFVH